eukprot:Blabericola_migrator_1__7620@NODE_3895_length_1442_cov_36_410909_g2308_i1_p1_GENE_NODE_3895_length_1442_cov_36_410909_g2308_i1NODE_3895_length_1442_cov_36_410909_g2308_i1_p1_ORF_typecomplete_len242_score49_56Glycolytic/PF00274_19/4_9e66_NODE_3895_length_1442_cov_36_410909_g2308_i13641089
MVDFLAAEGIIPGIKVDMGLKTLPGTDGEKTTQGLDGLAEGCKRYYEAGARFAKWRAVLEIDEAKIKPSPLSIKETAHSLVCYAAICQENRLIPSVEPEILTDGAHTIQRCARVTKTVLAEVFKALNDHHILLEGCLLKPNMVTTGAQSGKKSTCHDVAFYTVRTIRKAVPPPPPGGRCESHAPLRWSVRGRRFSQSECTHGLCLSLMDVLFKTKSSNIGLANKSMWKPHRRAEGQRELSS